MSDWLTPQTIPDGPLSPIKLLAHLLAALVFGGGVALIYRWSHGRERESSVVLSTTLVLLSVLIAMVSVTIGNSVARAFSLVGALSIVRFRTVVEDTRDTAFVIFAVIVGMACGAGLLIVPLLGVPLVGLTAIGLSRWPRLDSSNHDALVNLNVRLGLGRDPQATLSHVMQQHLTESRLVEMSTARQGSAVDLTYVATLRHESSMTALVADLNQVDGVLGVDVKRS